MRVCVCVCLRPYRGGRRGPRKRVRVNQLRTRSNYDDHQLAILTAEFNISQYLTAQHRAHLAARLSLTESQIKVWYQNRRAKMKKERRNHYDGLVVDSGKCI